MAHHVHCLGHDHDKRTHPRRKPTPTSLRPLPSDLDPIRILRHQFHDKYVWYACNYQILYFDFVNRDAEE